MISLSWHCKIFLGWNVWTFSFFTLKPKWHDIMVLMIEPMSIMLSLQLKTANIQEKLYTHFSSGRQISAHSYMLNLKVSRLRPIKLDLCTRVIRTKFYDQMLNKMMKRPDFSAAKEIWNNYSQEKIRCIDSYITSLYFY